MIINYKFIVSSLLYILNLIVAIKLIQAAKSGGGKAIYMPPIPENENASAIRKLSFSSPFIYHYSPWITRKLLLTLNSTSTMIQHFKLEQLQSIDINKILPLDYTCKELNQINLSKINIRTFQETNLDTSNLTCSELEYLHDQSLIQKNKIKEDKNYKNVNPFLNQKWSLCKVLDIENIDVICRKVNNINARKIMAPLEASISKSKNYQQAYMHVHHSLKDILSNYKLKYCSKFELNDVISKQNRDLMLNLILHKSNENTCKEVLIELVRMDALTNQFYCEFDQLLSRIYCQVYSVKETCDDCRMAYQQWLCSMVLPYHFEDILIKPCLSICQRVERTCPYLHPEIKDQYGGEPIFICNDPNIPFAENSTDLPYGKDHACYQRCHLDSTHSLTSKIIKEINLSNNLTYLPIEEKDSNEKNLHENPELEYCVQHQSIIRKLRNMKNRIDFENTLNTNLQIKSNTNSNQKKRKVPLKDEESISLSENDKTKKDIFFEENIKTQSKYMKNIFYLDNKNLSYHYLNPFTILSNNEESKTKYQNTKKDFNHEKEFHLTFKYSEDDENDTEDGDSDTEQIISTTASIALSAIVNKKSDDKKLL